MGASSRAWVCDCNQPLRPKLMGGYTPAVSASNVSYVEYQQRDKGMPGLNSRLLQPKLACNNLALPAFTHMFKEALTRACTYLKGDLNLCIHLLRDKVGSPPGAHGAIHLKA